MMEGFSDEARGLLNRFQSFKIEVVNIYIEKTQVMTNLLLNEVMNTDITLGAPNRWLQEICLRKRQPNLQSDDLKHCHNN